MLYPLIPLILQAKIMGYGIDANVLAQAQSLVDKAWQRFTVVESVDAAGNRIVTFDGNERRDFFLRQRAEKLMNQHR